jgi:hypothetical protein
MSWSWDTDPSNRHRRRKPGPHERVNVYRSSVNNILLSGVPSYYPDGEEIGLAIVVRFPRRDFEIVKERLSRLFEDAPLNGQHHAVFHKFSAKRMDIVES